MKHKMIFSGIMIGLVFSFWFSCAGTQNQETPGAQELVIENDSRDDIEDFSWQSDPSQAIIQASPSELIFLPGAFPSLEIAYGVGQITQDNRDRTASLGAAERAALSESYRMAYTDYLLRGAPLDGVLGGDLVHSWPANDPSGWVQNWRSSAPEINSFGLPALILAIKGLSANRVFLVQAGIMDYYGKSAGINGANGKMGYGAPRGYEFYYEGKIAQRFDLGLISVDTEGKGSFLEEEPPSLAFSASMDIGIFSNTEFSSSIQKVFLEACNMAIDQGVSSMVPDGAGQYLSLTGGSWEFPGGDSLKGIYFQSFNQRSIMLVLPDSALLPPYPRFIAPPFLDILLRTAEYPLLGGENMKALDIQFSGGDNLARSLMKGLSWFGIPLTDPVAVKGGEGSSSPWQAAQRFSRGWLVGPPPAP